MAENTGVQIVEIRAGESPRPVLELRPGVVVQPMSIGRVGMWSIDAPGVLDVHAYVYFDGRALFLQSADAGNPAKGNGQTVGAAWQQLEIPCTIEIGRARLVYRTLDEMDADAEDMTIAQPIQLPQRALQPPPQAPPQPQFSGGGTLSSRKGPDSDATRLAPMPTREPDPTIVSPLEAGGTATPMAGVPKARPAAGMPAWSTDGSPNSSPTTIGAPPAPPPPQNTGYQAFGSVQVAVPAPPPAPPMGGNPMGSTLQAPMQSPLQQLQMHPGYGAPMQAGYDAPMQPGYGAPMQPGMPMMGPPGMGPGGPSAETGRIQPPGELKGFKKAVAEWNAMPPLRKLILGTFPGVALLVYFMLFDDKPQVRRPPPMPSATISASPSASGAPSATAAPSASTNVAPTATAITSAMPSATAVIPTATATTTAKPPTHEKGKKSREREAIELVGQGQYIKAAEVYEQLAQENPQQPAFKEAARLLRLRGAGN